MLTLGIFWHHRMCEELQRVLGFDWLLLFMQGHLHPTTVQLALNILVAMLRSPENTRRFREGTHRGGWLADTENVLKNQMAVMLGSDLLCFGGVFLLGGKGGVERGRVFVLCVCVA